VSNRIDSESGFFDSFRSLTHSAKDYSVNDFGKGIGTRCPVEFLEFLDENGMIVKLACYFPSGDPREGLSKGLLILAKELKVPIRENVNLNELKKILNEHPAFQNVSFAFIPLSLYLSD
jgi:hypothetical protein